MAKWPFAIKNGHSFFWPFVYPDRFFDLIFEGRATYKWMKHVTQRRAELESGTKLFLKVKSYNSSYIKHFRADKLTSGDQFT